MYAYTCIYVYINIYIYTCIHTLPHCEVVNESLSGCDEFACIAGPDKVTRTHKYDNSLERKRAFQRKRKGTRNIITYRLCQ